MGMVSADRKLELPLLPGEHRPNNENTVYNMLLATYAELASGLHM